MAKTGLKTTEMLLLMIKPFSTNPRHYASKFAGKKGRRNPGLEELAEERRRSYWFPHPRSGIYFPKGQDGVMEDIPNDAASIHPTFWLRSADEGVDHKAHTQESL